MKDQPDQREPILSRRTALKALAAASGVTALATVPNNWTRPLIEVGNLPAFAQASSVSFPFSSDIVDLDPIDALITIDQGWLVFNIDNGTPSAALAAVRKEVAPIIAQTIPSSRPFPSSPPTWPSTATITIPYVFVSSSDVLPEDGTVVWLYGVSEDGQFAGAITREVSDGEVTFSFPVPSTYTGLFYLSARFFDELITLTNGRRIDSTYYADEGIFGDNAGQSPPGGGGGGGGQKDFSIFTTGTMRRTLRPDVNAGQIIKVTILADSGSWTLNLLDPDLETVQQLFSSSAPKILQDTAAKSGTYKLSLKTNSISGQFANVVGFYEIN
ncbi:MAG: hypothetical protein KDJ65_05210 [Anaerolineae bacterium]|nr:hypothetical protein [Anaerolineae bacterium]